MAETVYFRLLGDALAITSKAWAADELTAMDLGDARLNARAQTLVERFAAKPAASIPMACDSWAETCAAYRFLGNDEIDWRDIMAPHWAKAQQRMGAYGRCLDRRAHPCAEAAFGERGGSRPQRGLMKGEQYDCSH